MYYVNENIKNLYRVKFHDERKDYLRLDMNENPEGLPADFVEEIKKKITPEFIASYPEKDRLAKLLSEHNNIPAECISITCGSDEAMRLIFQCFGEQGKELLTVTPTFEMYDVYSKMFGMGHVMAEYNEDYSLSVDKALDLITENTGLVILLNPNSPIGACWNDADARAIIEKAASVGAVTVVDEAYHYFYPNTFMPLINEYDNLLVLRTFSKLFSCAGLRIGYVSGNKQLIHYIENAESTFNVSNVAILFAEELIKRQDMIEKLQEIEKTGREYLTSKLSELGYKVISKEGNYVLFMPNKPSTDIVSAAKEHEILIRDYSKGILKGWVRVSTGSIECMQRFVEVLIKNDTQLK